jgi:hypothetical protein
MLLHHLLISFTAAHSAKGLVTLVSVVADYLPDDRGSIPDRGKKLFSTASGPFQKELYSGVPNVPMWRVLRKIHLKAYKLAMVLNDG